MIDFVITWVDGADPSWQAQKQKYSPAASSDDAISPARYRDLGTLKYVFRSIEAYAPWVNRVHFVTEGHLPDWINRAHPKLNILKHSDIFANKADLPTFNSSAIELNFLGIPDLSEQFVIFNDDMLILKPVTPHNFFENGKPCDFLIQNPIKSALQFLLYGHVTWVHNIRNSIDLINASFNKQESIRKNFSKYFNHAYGISGNFLNILAFFSKNFTFFEHNHHPQPHLKSTRETVFATYGKEIRATSAHKFREKSDVTQYLFRYWNLVSGNFETSRVRVGARVVNVKSVRDINKFAPIADKNTFVCVNDVPELTKEYDSVKKALELVLENSFVSKSSFEL